MPKLLLSASQVLICLPLAAQAGLSGPEAILEGARLKGEAVAKARAAHLEAGGTSQDFRADVGTDLRQLETRLKGEKDPACRQALILAQLHLSRIARTAPAPALLERVFLEVPATHPGWALDKGLLLALGSWAPGAAGPYLARARAEHPSGILRRHLLFEHFTEMIDTRGEAEWKPSFEALRRDFPGSEEAARAADRLASELKTAVGVQAPSFQLTSLEDPAVKLDLGTFKGRYVLLDFWASWCPDCVAEMPGLHRAYARFHPKGLEVLSLSFDRKESHVGLYRKRPGTPMPWRHAFLTGGFKHPLSEAYGVRSIPKPVLIGPDGKVAASGAALHGANLEPTLEGFLGR